MTNNRKQYVKNVAEKLRGQVGVFVLMNLRNIRKFYIFCEMRQVRNIKLFHWTINMY